MKHAMFRLVPVLLIAFVFAGCTTTAKKDQGEGAAVRAAVDAGAVRADSPAKLSGRGASAAPRMDCRLE